MVILKISFSVKIRWLFWPSLLVFCVLGFAPSKVFGVYPTPVDFSGKLLVWKDISAENPLVFEVIADTDYDYERALAYAKSAAALWSSVPGSRLRMSSKEDMPDSSVQISIEISDDFLEAPDAGAYSYFDEVENGEAIHCKIKMRQSYLNYSMTFSKTVLHELGHCLGLGHSLIPESIMSYQLDKNSFALDVDDQAAISRMYPSSNSAPSLPPGCVARIKNSQSEKAHVDFVWIILFFIFIQAFILKKIKKSEE